MNPKNRESYDYIRNQMTLSEVLEYQEVLSIYHDLELAGHKDYAAKSEAQRGK